MLLIYAPKNQELKIIKVLAFDKLKKRLGDLGILPDEKITLLNSTDGSVICLIKEGRLALDNETASKILVA